MSAKFLLPFSFRLVPSPRILSTTNSLRFQTKSFSLFQERKNQPFFQPQRYFSQRKDRKHVSSKHEPKTTNDIEKKISKLKEKISFVLQQEMKDYLPMNEKLAQFTREIESKWKIQLSPEEKQISLTSNQFPNLSLVISLEPRAIEEDQFDEQQEEERIQEVGETNEMELNDEEILEGNEDEEIFKVGEIKPISELHKEDLDDFLEHDVPPFPIQIRYQISDKYTWNFYANLTTLKEFDIQEMEILEKKDDETTISHPCDFSGLPEEIQLNIIQLLKRMGINPELGGQIRTYLSLQQSNEEFKFLEAMKNSITN